MNPQIVEAIKELVYSGKPDENGQYDIGGVLSDAFEQAGLSLECHQQGVRGTVITATPV